MITPITLSLTVSGTLSMETRKLVDRAKGVLMKQHHLGEEEAFKRIRKASMDSRKTMREIAEAILLADKMSG